MAAIFAYSTGVWRLINDYFRQEFRTFLDEEVKKNKYLIVDPDHSAAPSPPAEIISESQVRKAQGSVTANRLLDEMILSFGRLFTGGDEAKLARRRTSAQPPTNKIITATSSSSTSQPVPGGIGTSSGSTDSSGRGGTVIESDKFRGSSSPEQENNNSDESDGRDCDDDDDANDVSDDDEENWIKYWKNREQGQLVNEGGSDGDGEGHCEAKVVDTCGP